MQTFHQFIASLFQTRVEVEWALLHNIEERIMNHNIWWKSSWAFFTNISGFCCNSLHKYHLWSYRFKAFHKLLLLGYILKQRHKDLYALLGCASCGYDSIEETWVYFMTCPALAPQCIDLYVNVKQNYEALILEMLIMHFLDLFLRKLKLRTSNWRCY